MKRRKMTNPSGWSAQLDKERLAAGQPGEGGSDRARASVFSANWVYNLTS